MLAIDSSSGNSFLFFANKHIFKRMLDLTPEIQLHLSHAHISHINAKRHRSQQTTSVTRVCGIDAANATPPTKPADFTINQIIVLPQ